MVDDGQVCGSGDIVGGQADEDVGLQGVVEGGLGRQQESCSWRFSAFSGLEVHTLSRSSSRGSNRCCKKELYCIDYGDTLTFVD